MRSRRRRSCGAPGNFTSIARKDFVITRTTNKVNTAGRKEELAYQTMNKGKALKRDIEKALGKFIQQPVVTVVVTAFVGPYSEQIRVIGEAAKPQALGQVLEMMGFRPIARHRSREVMLYHFPGTKRTKGWPLDVR